MGRPIYRYELICQSCKHYCGAMMCGLEWKLSMPTAESTECPWYEGEADEHPNSDQKGKGGKS